MTWLFYESCVKNKTINIHLKKPTLKVKLFKYTNPLFMVLGRTRTLSWNIISNYAFFECYVSTDFLSQISLHVLGSKRGSMDRSVRVSPNFVNFS